jgi:hypothetical protein
MEQNLNVHSRELDGIDHFVGPKPKRNLALLSGLICLLFVGCMKASCKLPLFPHQFRCPD